MGLSKTLLSPGCYPAGVTTGCEGEKKTQKQKRICQRAAEQHCQRTFSCMSRDSHCNPGLVESCCGCSGLCVGNSDNHWVCCWVLLFAFFSLNVKLTVELALVRQQAWCSFYLSRPLEQRRGGKCLDQFGGCALCNGPGVQSKGHNSQIPKLAWALADKSHFKVKGNPIGALLSA